MRTLIIHLLLCLLTSSIFAQQKIAVVDYDSVMQAHPLFDYGEELIDSLAQKLEGTLLEKQARLEDYYEEYMEGISHGCGGAPPARQQELEDSLPILQAELQELAIYADNLLITFETNTATVINEDIKMTIGLIAEKENITYCLDMKNVLFLNMDNTVDLTNLVIDSYNSNEYIDAKEEILMLYKQYIFSLNIKAFKLPENFIIPYLRK